MNLAYIGPVPISFHGNPTASWISTPTASGQRDASIGGIVTWSEAHQLSELVANPARTQTIGNASGVLEPIWFSHTLLGPFRGWYLLRSFDLSGEQQWSLTDIVPVSLEATFLGDRQPMTLSSSRQLFNEAETVGVSIVADPFYNENTTGTSGFLNVGSGTLLTREYDHDDDFSGAKTQVITGGTTPAVGRKMAIVLTSPRP